MLGGTGLTRSAGWKGWLEPRTGEDPRTRGKGRTRTPLQGWSHASVVGTGGRVRPLWSRKAVSADRSHHRSRHAPEPYQLVPGDQPPRSRLKESRAQRVRCGGSGGGGEALRPEELDRAKLQTGEELAWMGPLPGQEGSLHSPSLAAGDVRVYLLLVGV